MISHMMDVMKNLMTGEQLQNETKNVEDKMKNLYLLHFNAKVIQFIFAMILLRLKIRLQRIRTMMHIPLDHRSGRQQHVLLLNMY